MDNIELTDFRDFITKLRAALQEVWPDNYEVNLNLDERVGYLDMHIRIKRGGRYGSKAR